MHRLVPSTVTQLKGQSYTQFQQHSATTRTTHNSVLIWKGCLVIACYHGLWPPCSPYLSASDFHLWANLNTVYRNNPHIKKTLKKGKSPSSSGVTRLDELQSI
jgi:hypothetical protein